jgi:hypothetical protein
LVSSDAEQALVLHLAANLESVKSQAMQSPLVLLISVSLFRGQSSLLLPELTVRHSMYLNVSVGKAWALREFFHLWPIASTFVPNKMGAVETMLRTAGVVRLVSGLRLFDYREGELTHFCSPSFFRIPALCAFVQGVPVVSLLHQAIH